jgi:hypothetical protein
MHACTAGLCTRHTFEQSGAVIPTSWRQVGHDKVRQRCSASTSFRGEVENPNRERLELLATGEATKDLFVGCRFTMDVMD